MSEIPPAVPAPAPDHRRSSEAEVALARSRRRRRLALLVSPAALLAILVIGEIVARVAGVRAITGFVSAGDRGWAPAPGTRDFDDVPGSVSAGGTRGPEGKPGGILLVGDETVFGAGLRDDETLGAALSRELKVHATLAACDGYGAQQESLWIRELAPRLTPAAVVVVVSPDDPRPFAATLFTSIRLHLQRFSALAASAAPVSRPLSRAELSDLYQPDGVPWRLFQQSMREIGAWSKQSKVPVLVAVWPFPAKDDDALAEYFEQVRGEARLNGLQVRNLRDDLGADLEKLRLPGGRWNGEAMTRAAKGIAEALR